MNFVAVPSKIKTIHSFLTDVFIPHQTNYSTTRDSAGVRFDKRLFNPVPGATHLAVRLSGYTAHVAPVAPVAHVAPVADAPGDLNSNAATRSGCRVASARRTTSPSKYRHQRSNVLSTHTTALHPAVRAAAREPRGFRRSYRSWVIGSTPQTQTRR